MNKQITESIGIIDAITENNQNVITASNSRNIHIDPLTNLIKTSTMILPKKLISTTHHIPGTPQIQKVGPHFQCMTKRGE